MKKVVYLFTVYSSLFTGAVFAYTQADVSNAQFLADKGIIVKQSTTAGYRLDSTITRAELVGIALKLKGVTLPSYQCKGYFTDVRNNDWICRAVEISADHGLVTRANAKFRAQDKITRAEALAIVTRDIEDLPNSYEDPTNYIDANSWQIKIIRKTMAAGIINPEVRIGKDMGGMFAGFKEKNVYFYPNRAATRAEVFAFVRNILNGGIIINGETRVVGGNNPSIFLRLFSETPGPEEQFLPKNEVSKAFLKQNFTGSIFHNETNFLALSFFALNETSIADYFWHGGLSTSKANLRIVRNMIYAQHGRKFESPDLQNFFDSQSWYKENPNYSDSLLSEIDLGNISFIQDKENFLEA